MNWDKVAKCKHEDLYENYCVTIACLCDSGVEYHCRDCQAFIIECGCGSVVGISGWSNARHVARRLITDATVGGGR